MLSLTAIMIAAFQGLNSAHIPNYSRVQFYYTEAANKSIELWTEDQGSWKSVINPLSIMPVPANPENYKACDIQIEINNRQAALPSSATIDGGTIRAPALFIEGIDFYDEMPGKAKSFSADNLAGRLHDFGIADVLLANGDDLITLNMEHSSIDIFRNGEFVSQVLLWMSAHLESSSPPIKVVGISMGGLVGRWAIHRFENALRKPSQSSIGLYISLDSPHQGANIPVTVPNMINGLALVSKDNDPSRYLSDMLFFSDAVKQISLRDHVGNGPDQKYFAFQEKYEQSKVMPKMRQVAITNGSLVGVEQEYLPRDGFSDYSITKRFVATPSLLYTPLSTALIGKKAMAVRRRATEPVLGLAIFNMNIQAGMDQVSSGYSVDLYRKLSFADDISVHYSNSWSSNIPYDIAPGGYFPFYSMISGQLNSSLDAVMRNDSYREDWDHYVNYIEAGHACFIPSVSAIDYRKPDRSAAVFDRSYVFANLKSVDPNVSAHTSFDAVYGVNEKGFSSVPGGRDAGFWRNELHAFGLSEDNGYRILCEMEYADKGSAPVGDVCSDATKDRSLDAKIWHTIDLRGENGPPNWAEVTEINDRHMYPASTDFFIKDHQDALVFRGKPIIGWQEVYKLPYLLEPGDEVSVDINVPSGRYDYLSLTGTLAGADDGCGWHQLATNVVNTSISGWQTFKWTVPSFYKPQCNTSPGALDYLANFKLFLNAPKVSRPLMITGLRVVRAGKAVKTTPKLPVAKSQIIPFASGTSFLLGDWGTNDRDYGGLGYLKVSANQSWQGAVLFNNGGLDVSGYNYLEVEAKSSAPYGMSKMMIFLDDHPELVLPASTGWKNPYPVNPYGKRYNFWESMEYIGSSGDGYETRRVPLSWLTSTKTTGKILIQLANWYGTVSEDFVIRSMRFVK